MTMVEKRWERLKEIAAAAFEMPPQERRTFLDEACGTDQPLRLEIERLVAAHDRDPDFLTRPVLDALSHVPGHHHPTREPTVLIKDPARRPDGMRKKGVLPPEMLERAGHRLRLVALAYAVGYALIYTIEEILAHAVAGRPVSVSAHVPGFTIALVFIILSLSVSWTAWRGGLAPHVTVRLGLGYEVVGSLGIALGTTSSLAPNLDQVWGISWICVWIVSFVLIMPAAPRHAAYAAFASAAMGPMALGIWSLAGVQPWPETNTLLAMTIPNFFCAAIASVGAAIVFGMGLSWNEARQLGSYTLISVLGRGGMGEVWLARHRMLARPAALKLVRPEVFGDPETAYQHFEREARSTAELSSPHTVTVYDFGITQEGVFYYVMELLDGLDLDSLVRRFGPLPPERAIQFLRHACASLAEAHGRGLVHRDIKPANMYACRLGLQYDVLKVLDFGLVRRERGDEPAPGPSGVTHIVGTPHYLAPEIALHHAATPKSDLYSLGCVGYWLLSGRAVFEGASAVEIITNHIHSTPPTLSERSKHPLPPRLGAILTKCLEKDPSRRPANAAELDEELQSIDVDDAWTTARSRGWWKHYLPTTEPSPDYS